MQDSSTIKEDINIHFARRFDKVRKQSLHLAAPLKPEDTVVQPVVDVSPPKWHLAHTTWFFEQFLLIPFMKDYQTFNPSWHYLFNSYYDSVGDRVQRDQRGFITRPGLEEIKEYRAHVDMSMAIFLKGDTLSDEQQKILEIGLQHEQQHQELLCYDIKRILGFNPLRPAYRVAEEHKHSDPRPLGWLAIPEGNYSIGHEGQGFCFDNELGRHQVYLQAFEAGDRLVSNAEFIAFIEAGGYTDFRHWLSEGWGWVNDNEIKHPLYWQQEQDQWYGYTYEGMRPINPADPVTHISFYEADAFARWKGKRLLTEFEWEVLCRHYEPTIPETATFVEKGLLHPQPAVPGHYQLHGDVWEWTNSAYLPYPYFQTDEGALGEYNGKFMINQMVLRGGSCVTPRDHIRPTYRNFFHPHLQWLFAGFRLARHT